MNDFYPFPCVPPFIPKDKELGVYRIAPDRLKKIDGSGEYNNIGVYRTFFDVRDLRKKYVISFLGVISSLDLFINGQYVGYSEGAHNTAEFLLDKYLIEGRNELGRLPWLRRTVRNRPRRESPPERPDPRHRLLPRPRRRHGPHREVEAGERLQK